MLTGLALPAAADPLDQVCKEVPAPVRPDFQTAGLVMDKPDLAEVPDASPDPFKDPKVPISDVYGWAWRYTNYDLGCGSDFIRDPNAVASTNIANVAMAGLATMTSAVNSVENMSRSASFEFFKPVVGSIADILDERVLTVWLPLALLVVSVIVGFGATRASYSETFRRLLVVVVCVALAVVALVFPVRAVNLMDDGATAVAEAAQAGFSPRASDLITRQALYQTWLVGNFGSADSPTALEYGPRLMSALTYTWSDVKRMNASPGAQDAIDKAKAAEFRKIATEMEKKDPAAYESFTGKTDTRTAGTILGGVWVLIMGFFVVLASVITVVARLVMIALVVAAPIGVVVGVVKYAVLQRMWDLFTAALVNIVKFTVAAGAMTLILGAIYNAPVGMGWQLLFAIVATVIALMITKPVTSLKSMAGLDPTRHYLGELLRRMSGTAVGVVAGNRVSDHSADADRGAPLDVPVASPGETAYRMQPVEPSMPPLPPPSTVQALPVGYAAAPRVQWAEAEHRVALQSEPVPGADRRALPAPTRVSPNALPNQPVEELPPEDSPRLLRPVRAVPVAGTAVRRPVVTEQTAFSVVDGREHTEPPISGPAGRPITNPSRQAPVVDATVAAPPHPAPIENPRRTNVVDHEPAARPAGTTVTYPTGIVVQNEHGIYRPDRPLRIEEYLRFPEPQVDANGDETWTPLYHAKAGR
ncbi:MAG TPA: hypothetical protein VNT24_10845 [Propionibacteriaceae bacterium]|nr:hypothetical protein [Propionibacteriaceae bacterium]